MRLLIALPVLTVLMPNGAMAQAPTPSNTLVKFGNSYVNVTKRTIGGTVENGDILEIRTGIWFANNYNSANGYAVYYSRYYDNVPTNTVFADDSLRIITNEGLTYKNWTIAGGDDPGTYNASPTSGQYNVKINLGRTATAPSNTSNNTVGGGRMATGNNSAKDKPLAGGALLMTTAFRVRVTGNSGDTIVLGAGQVRYRLTNSTSGISNEVIFSNVQYKILISDNDPICPNSVGRNFVAEYGGTFDSGNVQNRVAPPNYIISGYGNPDVSPSQQLGDGNYAIVNNLSPWASTFRNAQKRPVCTVSTSGNPPAPTSCANRMFTGHWDIIGDHTGSTTAAGNDPTAAGSLGGYMLAVNADYAMIEAYRQSITGLCPNTSYEFSLWIRNVCTNCGVDSLGSATYKPGVYPNLSFAIDGIDRYSSGQIDTIGWQKRGFLFKTGPTQTAITISIRNNASGGGGNDWAIDDVALVTCNPNLNLVPTGDAQVCYGQQVNISSSVTSFFDNYTYYRFEKSTDGGATWSVPQTGNGTPQSQPGGYYYNAALPPFLADSGDHMNQYRFIVASSAANLSNPDCSFMANTRIVVMVNNCSVILSTKDSTTRQRRQIDRTMVEEGVRRLVNPFSTNITFDIVSVADNVPASIMLMDSHGRIIRRIQTEVSKGLNKVMIDQLSDLSSGSYFLRIQLKEQVTTKVLVKGR